MKSGKKILYYLSGLLLFLVSPVWSQQATVESDISLRTVIERTEVPVNREVVYHVELRWSGDLSKYQLSDIVDPVVSNLSVRGKGSSNKVITDSAGQTISIKRITYYLTPLELGMAYIDGVTVRYEDTGLGQEESLISGRIGVKIIEPVAEPAELNLLNWLVYAVILLFLTLVSFLIYRRYRRQKAEQLARMQALPQESTEEKYLRLLKETIHFASDNIRESVGDLSHLIRGYFSEKYHLPPGNLSDADLLLILKEKELDETSLARLKDFFEKTNLIKFAAEDISESDFHQNYDTVELLLQNQKTKAQTEKNGQS